MNCVQFLRGNKQQQRQQVRQRSGRAFTSSDRALIISIFFTLTMGGKCSEKLAFGGTMKKERNSHKLNKNSRGSSGTETTLHRV